MSQRFDNIPLVLGDLDGDLDLDLAVVNDLSNNVSILLMDCPPACPVDLDGSGDVDFGDLLVLLGAWGAGEWRVRGMFGDGTRSTPERLESLLSLK